VQSHEAFASERRVRFTEMEYALPREHGPVALRRVVELIRERRIEVFFPIEFRVVAADDAMLSPAHERPTAYIAVHQFEGMEWRPYFEAVEAIMRDYDGRPHWASATSRPPSRWRRSTRAGRTFRARGEVRPGGNVPQRIHRPDPSSEEGGASPR